MVEHYLDTVGVGGSIPPVPKESRFSSFATTLPSTAHTPVATSIHTTSMHPASVRTTSVPRISARRAPWLVEPARIALAVGVLALAGCYQSTVVIGGDVDGGRGDAGGTVLRDATTPLRDAVTPAPDGGPSRDAGTGIEFGACPPDPMPHARSECATIAFPADWSRPGEDLAEVGVRRVRPRRPSRPVTAQLWLLQGGPGGGSEELDAMADLFDFAGLNVELYMIDHRGVGRNRSLACPDNGSSCAREVFATITDPSIYGTTPSAEDIRAGIEQFRRDEVPVFVYGVSYGTYWAHRLSQIAPDAADGFILDSICSPGRCILTSFNDGFEDVGRQVLARCDDDPACASHFMGTTEAAARRAVANLENRSCVYANQVGFTAEMFRQSLAGLLAVAELRSLIPAVIFRTERCSVEDSRMFATLYVPEGEPPPDFAFSFPLYAIIARSELSLPTLPTPTQLRAAVEGTLFGVYTDDYELVVDAPHYEHDAYWGVTTPSMQPFLLMQGTLDPQTHLEFDARPLIDELVARGDTYLEIPDAPHAVLRTRCSVERFAEWLGTQSTLAPCALEEENTFSFSDPQFVEFLGVTTPFGMARRSTIPARRASPEELARVRRAYDRAIHLPRF